MSVAPQQLITLIEYRSATLPQADFAEHLGLHLRDTHKHQVNVEFPSIGNSHQWQFTAQSYVGYIPLAPAVGIRIQPKIPIQNLFGMLEYAYNLGEFKLLANWHHCDTLEDLYERLADILARRISDRARRGLYRTYIPKTERLSCLRGRLDIPHQIRHPWETRLQCHYQEQTADIAENQILLWTLHQIRRHGVCSERVLLTVRKAYRALQGTVTLTPCTARDCTGHTYNRLNTDYQSLHALCRFFLDHSGPSLASGDRRMIPFLINMNDLFEAFVYEWLKAHAEELLKPVGLRLKQQAPVPLDTSHFGPLKIDLVLEDIQTDTTRYVLDTKYKRTDKLNTSDLHQAIAYAETKDTTEAILVYPQALIPPLDIRPNKVRVRGLAFNISQDLNEAGRAFVKAVLETGSDSL
ncbi:McrC family protein [Halomicronema sp. CCY15110]|uniref:McrC family protein n=1 Tax=Halomicronema sp. CCY15110 TaxID=2767773 RepID=UPI00194E7C98|nr:restriction endonuclease [Halomicronema sp. CCY15110]